MTKKNILRTLLLGVFSLGLVIPTASASAATAIVDNDALSGAPGYNQSGGSWTWRSGSGYNNDHRIIPSISANNEAYYLWHYNVRSVNASYYVYLANPSFNSPRAGYQVGEYGGFTYINQNTAPTGWSYLNSYSGTNHFVNLAVIQSTKSGNLGVDATKITY